MAKRRPPEIATSNSDDFIREGIASLHDVFLNASVQRDRMEKSPVEKKPDDLMWFLTSDRGRLERFWIMSLYVLVESWESEFMKPIRERLATLLPFPPRVEVSSLGDGAVLTGALAIGVRAALENAFSQRR